MTPSLHTHLSAFFVGMLASAGVFWGTDFHQHSVEVGDSQKLAGAVLYAGAVKDSSYRIVRENSMVIPVHFGATTSATTTTASSTDIRDAYTEIDEPAYITLVVPSSVVDGVSDEDSLVETAALLSAAQAQIAALQEKAHSVIQSGGESQERTLPDGVYQLANGDYVDIHGQKIEGDPYAYNYKPPQKEEEFVTPGGVIMNRFGVIIHTPELIDESKVYIPASVVDPDNPPPAVAPIYIPRHVTLAVSQNPFLTCTQLLLYGNEKALCELYKNYKDDYEWVQVDVEE